MYNFFRAIPVNTLISLVFPDTSCPIMQMYEVKRPGPGYDRSETTSALLWEQFALCTRQSPLRKWVACDTRVLGYKHLQMLVFTDFMGFSCAELMILLVITNFYHNTALEYTTIFAYIQIILVILRFNLLFVSLHKWHSLLVLLSKKQ